MQRIRISLRLPRPCGLTSCASRQIRFSSASAQAQPKEQVTDSNKFVQQRIASLGGEAALPDYFPRWRHPDHGRAITAADFISLNASRDASKQNERRPGISHTVYGRVTARRKQGSKLTFIDVESGRGNLQIVLNRERLADGHADDGQYQAFRRNVQRGDWIVVTGGSYTTSTGQLSLLAHHLPKIISPSIQPLPETLQDTEVRSRNRHVERILDRSSTDPLIVRHALLMRMRSFFATRDFVEVNTPLITAGFGGAVARPFELQARDLPDLKLNLRIAPELWLKRLIVGNMSRVFEIGPAFRNEGVDSTHNPEFSICEFYQIMTDLDELIGMTETLFGELHDECRSRRDKLPSIPDLSNLNLRGPFRRVAFIPGIQDALREQIPGWNFPDLNDPMAMEALKDAARHIGIALQDASTISLPKLLDELCSELLEGKYPEPTWITHHPECMSPLSKSFAVTHGDREHRVSARAELFIRGREYVNCYEEENSPVEQRRKFEEQLRHRNVEGEAVVDEAYIETLTWGMPPTGGWGCGIDRLVMLFSGRERIADVLPFGNLVNVAGLGSQQGR